VAISSFSKERIEIATPDSFSCQAAMTGKFTAFPAMAARAAVIARAPAGSPWQSLFRKRRDCFATARIYGYRFSMARFLTPYYSIPTRCI